MVFSQLSYKTQKKILIVSFLIIPLALLLTFGYLPLFNLFRYSFHRWNGYSKDMEFVGLKNYIRFFSEPEYFQVFKNSLYYFAGSFIQTSLALFFVAILSTKVKGRNFFKGVIFFPSLLNSVAIGFIFLYFFKPDGTFDTVLQAIGLEGIIHYWIRNPRIINVSLAGTSVWRYLGGSFIIFLGAMQSIPPSFYEAAEIDGANKWRQFKYITFPSIKRIVELMMILAVSGSIRVFETPRIMTRGGNGSMTFVLQTMETAFESQKYGLASAMGIILLIIVVLVTLLQKWLFAEREELA